MKTLIFMYCCLYYYGKTVFRNPGYALTLLALLFVTHKLAGWATWVMSL